jgi:hypothetical protein
MAGFRGTDEALEHEIETLERIGRVRLRRASDSLREVDRDLRELKREQARRRARALIPEVAVAASDATA